MIKFDKFEAHKIALNLTKLVVENGTISTHTHGKDLAVEIIDFYNAIADEFTKDNQQ
ncbi:MAG: hypothetical protein IJ168_07950 [Eubacterium sp.]|nr:hypothetical protein [Eubacterium sp.]